jgi:hypothetical protein
VSQPREAGSNGSEDARRAVAILEVGGMDDRRDQQAQGIGQDMTLAAFDFLARVIPVRPLPAPA